MGFAYSPRIFLLLEMIPVALLQTTVTLGVTIWVWEGMVVATRQALDYSSTLRAVGVTFIGFLTNGRAITLLLMA